MFDLVLLCLVIVDLFKKFMLCMQFCNLVMFCVYVGSILIMILWIVVFVGQVEVFVGFIFVVMLWLWFMVLFVNFVEVFVEGCLKVQVVLLCSVKKDVMVKKFNELYLKLLICIMIVFDLCKGDVVFVEIGDVILVDGEVVDGVVLVDELVIIGEFVLVICELGGDFLLVMGGMCVLFDWIVVKVIVNFGEVFFDQMIVMVEGVKCKKMLNEIVLMILFVVLMIVMLFVIVMLLLFLMFLVDVMKVGYVVMIIVLVVLFVCLILMMIGGLLFVIGVVGMSWMMQVNVIVMLGCVVEVVGDVDVLLFDKIGMIMFGNCQVLMFVLVLGVIEEVLVDVV